MLEFTFLLMSTLIGMAAGAMSGALGVGASLVFVPALQLILPLLHVRADLVPAVSVATALAASCVVTVSAVLAHLRAGNIDGAKLRQARPLLLWAGAGGAIGGMTIAHSDSVAATLGPAVAQIVVAVVLALRSSLPRGGANAEHRATASKPLEDWVSRVYVGVVGGLTSIGAGGVFLVPYFLWRGLPRVQAAALASLVGIAITPVATLVFITGRPWTSSAATLGDVHLPLAFSLAAGSLFGARAGAGIARVAHGAAWLRALSAFLLFASARAIARIV